MPELYEKACRWVNERMGPEPEELEEKKEKRKQEFLDKKEELRRAEELLRKAEIVDGKDSNRYKKSKKDHEKKKKAFEKSKRKHEREEFRRTMKFLNLDFNYDEIMTFSVFLSILGFVMTIIGIASSILLLDMGIYEVILYGIPALTAVPSITLYVSANYPEIAEKRMKANSIGELPETINFMTMSMRINPSLHKAISFASENSKEPISSGLKQISWKVYMREKASLEEAFLDFALRWGEWNDNLKRSFYAVRSALLEKSDEGFKSALERANKLIIEGTKQDVKDFTNSLQTPTTILFAIGVLLPMIVGAMLPMLALGGLNVSGMSLAGERVSSGNSVVTLPLVVLLMNVVSPLGAFLYSYHIIGKRPGTRTSPNICEKENRLFHSLISSIIFVSTAILISFFYSSLSYYMPVPFIFLFILPVSYFFISTTYENKKKRESIDQMEKEFPDALFQLGSRIAEGCSMEKALIKTSDSLQETNIGELFNDITSTLRISRLSLEETLFGRKGIIKDHPSKTIKTTMKTVLKIAEKDPEEAGKTIMNIANYQQDLQKMDKEIKNMLSKSVQMMKGTAMFFAPIMMGVISSLYFMMEGIFTGLGTVELISPVAFSSTMSLYLVLMAGVITYFSKGIENSLDSVEFRYSFGKTILIAMTVYSLALIMGKTMIVGF